MATVKGETCRVCGKGKTRYVALTPFKDTSPHRYAVCIGCYRMQWAEVYGEDNPCPVEAIAAEVQKKG